MVYKSDIYIYIYIYICTLNVSKIGRSETLTLMMKLILSQCNIS